MRRLWRNLRGHGSGGWTAGGGEGGESPRERGTGLPKDRNLVLKYKTSAEYFKKEAISRNASVSLTAHLFADNGYANLEKAGNLKSNEQNPFIMSKEDMEKYLNSLIERAEKELNK